MIQIPQNPASPFPLKVMLTEDECNAIVHAGAFVNVMRKMGATSIVIKMDRHTHVIEADAVARGLDTTIETLTAARNAARAAAAKV